MIFQDKTKKPEPGIRSINLDGKKGGWGGSGNSAGVDSFNRRFSFGFV